MYMKQPSLTLSVPERQKLQQSLFPICPLPNESEKMI